MSSLTGLVSLLIFIATARSPAPPSPNPAIDSLSSASSSLAILHLSSVADDASLINSPGMVGVICDGSRWGYNLAKASCEDVWRKLPTDSEIFAWGERSEGYFERPLPYRYLSSKFSIQRLGVTISLLTFRIQATVSVLSISFICMKLFTILHPITIFLSLPKVSWTNAS